MREVCSILYMNLETNSFGILFHADLGRPRPQRTNRATEWVLWAGLGGLQEGRVQKEEVPLPACTACAVCLKQYSSAAVPKAFNVLWSGLTPEKSRNQESASVSSRNTSPRFVEGKEDFWFVVVFFLFLNNLGKVFKQSCGGSACKESLCCSQCTPWTSLMPVEPQNYAAMNKDEWVIRVWTGERLRKKKVSTVLSVGKADWT